MLVFFFLMLIFSVRLMLKIAKHACSYCFFPVLMLALMLIFFCPLCSVYARFHRLCSTNVCSCYALFRCFSFGIQKCTHTCRPLLLISYPFATPRHLIPFSFPPIHNTPLHYRSLSFTAAWCTAAIAILLYC